MQVVAIILAAGKGTRMGGERPKVLSPLAGAPLIHYPLQLANELGVKKTIVVVGYGEKLVRDAVEQESIDNIEFVVQSAQLGTGHAVRCAMPALSDHDGPVLILSGDVPLLSLETVRALTAASLRSSTGLAFLIFKSEDKTGYGRIIRDRNGQVLAIREERDADAQELALSECNAGVYCAQASLLARELPRIGTENSQQEFYLTDLISAATHLGKIETIEVDPIEVAGVNTPEQLASLERSYLARKKSRRG